MSRVPSGVRMKVVLLVALALVAMPFALAPTASAVPPCSDPLDPCIVCPGSCVPECEVDTRELTIACAI